MHVLIVGMTESGKTTLAKVMAKALKAKGETVAVLDPLSDPEWEADFQTQDSDAFLAWAKANKSAFLFVDEGGQSIGRYNEPMAWLATQSRHWGHSSVFISQGVTQLPPIVRQQCSKVYVFACGERNTDLIAEEWREKALQQVGKLEAGEFFVVSRFAEPIRGRVDFSKRVVSRAGAGYNGTDIQEIPHAKDAENEAVMDDGDSSSNDGGLRNGRQKSTRKSTGKPVGKSAAKTGGKSGARNR